LGSSIARIADERRERYPVVFRDYLGGGLNQQPDLPVSGVITEGDRLAVWGSNPPLGTEQQKLGWYSVLSVNLSGSYAASIEEIAPVSRD
jgi:hypothetical protein